MKTNYKVLFKYYEKCKVSLFMIAILSTASAIIPISITQISGEIVTQISLLEFEIMDYVLLACLNLLSFLLNFSQSYIQSILTYRISNSMLVEILRKMIHGDFLKTNYTYDKPTFMQMCLGDLNDIQVFTVSEIPNIVKQIITAIISFVILWNIDIIIPFVALIVNSLVLLFVYFMGKKQKTISSNLRDSDIAINSSFFDAFRNIRQVKYYGKENKHQLDFEEINNQWCSNNVKSRITNNFIRTMVSVINAVSPTIVLIILGYKVFIGTTPIGSVVVAIGLLPTLSAPFSSLSNLHLNLKRNLFKAKGIADFLNLEEESMGKIVLKEDKPKMIQINNVNFIVNNKAILSNVSLNIPPGKHVAIVGFSGSGKTTLIKIVAGLLPVTSGEIKYNNVSLGEINQNSLFNQLSLMLHDVYIEKSNLTDNIFTIDDKDRMHNTLNILKIFDDLSIEEILKYELEEDGRNMSGGQKKKLNILRSMSVNRQYYFFDELTSGIDEETRLTIIRFVKNELRGKTCLFVTHDLDLARSCDFIVLVNKGNIEKIGTHDDMLKNSTTYQKLQKDWEGCIYE